MPKKGGQPNESSNVSILGASGVNQLSGGKANEITARPVE